MKRDPRLHGLSEDHHHALALARRILAALEAHDLAGANELVRRGFEVELAPHLAAEEEVLVPAMQAAGLGALAQRILDDHVALAALQAGGDAGPLRRFADLLVEHVRFEEREVFPVVEQRLADAALAAVAARTPRRSDR